jgi:hypothetical protein
MHHVIKRRFQRGRRKHQRICVVAGDLIVEDLIVRDLIVRDLIVRDLIVRDLIVRDLIVRDLRCGVLMMLCPGGCRPGRETHAARSDEQQPSEKGAALHRHRRAPYVLYPNKYNERSMLTQDTSNVREPTRKYTRTAELGSSLLTPMTSKISGRRFKCQ